MTGQKTQPLHQPDHDNAQPEWPYAALPLPEPKSVKKRAYPPSAAQHGCTSLPNMA